MGKITFIEHDGTEHVVEFEAGASLKDIAVDNAVPGIDADCGGGMACATCHVYVEDSWLNKIPKAEDAEQDMIDMAYKPNKNSRLSCQIVVSDEIDGLTVTTPEKQT